MLEVRMRLATPADARVVEDYHHRCFLNTYASLVLTGALAPPDRAGTRRQLHDWFLPGSGGGP